MAIFGNNILAGASGTTVDTGAAVGTYTGKSLVVNNPSNHRLSKTWGSAASDLDKFTISVWIKRTTVDSGSTQYWLFGAASPKESNIRIQADKIYVHLTGSNYDFTGTRLLRDTNNWYHLVFRYDSDQAAAGDRFKCYINGELETWASSSTIPSGQDNEFFANSAPMQIGNDVSGANDFDGYMAGITCIDGQSLGPEVFAHESPQTGSWVMEEPPVAEMIASGGNTDAQISGTQFKKHVFTSSGTLTVTQGGLVEYLVVGGGGGGGGNYGGGGGAGGFHTGFLQVTAGSYSVTVGAGGAGGNRTGSTSGLDGATGSNSVFHTITSLGGGGGGATDSAEAGLPGGSGGGSRYGGAVGAGTSGQGNNGGLGSTSASNYGSGGGGGASAVGAGGSGSAGGTGGAGTASTITGASVTYAGGGGGGVYHGGTPGSGGSGGGGAAGAAVGSGTTGSTGTAGTANTGGGGGGGSAGSNGGVGAAGGSGIVVVRYFNPSSFSFGTYGFYFDFSDTDSTTVTDNSANSNTFTATNYSSDVDAFYVEDTPVNNFCTFNELNEGHGVISNGGITWNGTDGTANFASFGVNKGQWYWECDNSSAAFAAYMGVTGEGYVEANTSSVNNGVFLSYAGANGAYKDYTGTSYTALTAFTAKGVYGFELDADAGRIYYYIGGVLKYVDNTLPADNSIHFIPFVYATNSGVGGWGSHNYNFGCPMVSGTDQSDANSKGSFEKPVLAHHNLISRSSGTTIGNMTAGGNLAASFDGSLRKAHSGCSQTTSNPDEGGFIGKDWGSGQSKTVTRVMVHPTHEYGFVGGASSTYTIDVRGADTAPTGSNYHTHGTSIASSGGNITDSNAATVYDTLSFGHSVTTTTAYRFLWVVVHPTGGDDDAFISQCEFFESSTNNYLALCSANLPEVVIGQEADDLASDYFSTTLYAGNATQTRTISGIGFQPDLVWQRIRSGTTQGTGVWDVLRGFTGANALDLAETSVEGTFTGANAAEYGFVSGVGDGTVSLDDGTTAGTGGFINHTGRTYALWCWKGGTAQGSTSTSGSGTAKTYTANYNVDAGFQMSAYTGNGTSGHTLPIHLLKAPEVVILKRRAGSADWWGTFHIGTDSSAPEDYYLPFDANDARQDLAGFLNDTLPTASVVTLGNNSGVNGNDVTYLMYAWHSVDGFSKFGSYTGNNDAEGPFICCNFRPQMVITRRTDSGDHWRIIDNKRHTVNDGSAPGLKLNDTDQEADAGNRNIDFLSNGFKIRDTDADTNANGGNYVYMAFAETPFKYSNAK